MSTQINNIKIVHLLYSGLGGHSSVFFNIASSKAGVQFSHIAFFGGVETLNQDSESRCINQSIPFIFLLKKQGVDLKFNYQIFKTLLKDRPKILMLHGAGFLIPVLFYKIISLKTRILIRDTQAPHLKTKFDWCLLIIAHFFCDKMVFLTVESFQSLKKVLNFLFNNSKSLIIPNGVNSIQFYQKTSLFNKETVNLGMQSRLQQIKDHPTLIKAFSLLIAKNTDYNFKLHIAGDGATIGQLKFLTSQLKLEDHIIFYGMLEEEELIDFMQNLDIYIHATFGETMSNSILQAMACGLPIVASDVKGVNNLIKNNQNGLLYESENIQQLMEKIYYLVINPIIATEVGNTARNEVENHYSNEIMNLKYLKTFISMIKE